MTADPHSPPPQTAPSQPSFEEALAELETLVDTLEKGDLTLEASLGAFERGVELTRTCRKVLDEAEQKVRILTERSAQAQPQPFQDHD